ncbi:transcription elongation factor [Exidia glandulosa HHB12029]|uniref:Transcription elongation factor n=1 Tax=Exidia glandulosa HHB12029 TaxID=1314781 RepID=A0A165M8B8_EXIGL|nr:transcription elongation factor [Exidia glandulosa HHB12029]
MTDASELKKLIKDLQAAIEPKDLIDVLNLLKKNVKATETLLRETKAGLAVGKLRTHASPEVSELAKAVVKKWKGEVDAAKGSSPKHNQAASTPAKSTTPTIVAKASPVAAAASPTTPGPLSASAVRSTKTDGVKLPTTGDKVRDKCIEMVYDALASDSGAPSEQILNRSTNIEKTVFNAEGGTTQPYRAKMRSLFLNLKGNSNPALRASVVSGDLTVSRLCTMTKDEMASEERKQADAAIKEMNFHKSLGAGEPEAETTAFQCSRCKQWKTRYRQAQTRSADEPMTTFVTCVNCNNRWKFS